MLDPNPLPGMRIRPASYVSSGEDAASAGLEILVHHHAVIDIQPGLLSKLKIGPDPNSGDDEVGFQLLSSRQRNRAVLDGDRRLTQMECHAMLLVHGPDEITELGAEYLLEGPILRRDHVDIETPGAERRRDLEADETRTNYDGA